MNTILMAALLAAHSPYIARVYEFCPAPGQFLNDVPEVVAPASPVDAAAEQLVGDARPGLISLGAFGGYVVFGFDHPVVNVVGEADFRVYGNAVMTNEAQHLGSAEPGVVYVSQDTNGNGLPDDEWFELEGSEAENASRHLTITYFRPSADHQPVTDSKKSYLVDAEYIAWECSDGTSGWLEKNREHSQNYWPEWIDSESITFENVTRLPDNGVDSNGKGTNYITYFYDWGYADNKPLTDPEGFDISHAVDAEGRPIALTHIDFIKVQTGVRQTLGWLGESSTEVAGAEDLHPDAPLPESGLFLPTADDLDSRAIDLRGLPALPEGHALKRGARGTTIIVR